MLGSINTSRLLMGLSLIVLGIALGSWYWYRELQEECTFPVSRRYEIYFEWRGTLKSVRAIDGLTHTEESASRVRAVISKESAEIARKIIADSQLDNADGSFTLTLAGCKEPYLVTWNSANIPLVSKLLAAAETWNADEVRRLVATGINVNARDLSGHTALLLAASNPRKTIRDHPELQTKVTWMPDVETLKLLLDAGANPNTKDSYGVTPLMLADDTTAPILLEAGGDVNAHDNLGKTPLMYWAEKGEADMIRLVARKGANVNAQDGKGWTALMYAAKNGSVETVRAILESGANKSVKNNDGETALSIAMKHAENDPQFRRVVKLLD